MNQREKGTTAAFAAPFLLRADQSAQQPAKSPLLSSLTNWLDKIGVGVPPEQLLVALVALWNSPGGLFLALLAPLLQPALCHGSWPGPRHVLHLGEAKTKGSRRHFQRKNQPEPALLGSEVSPGGPEPRSHHLTVGAGTGGGKGPIPILCRHTPES